MGVRPTIYADPRSRKTKWHGAEVYGTSLEFSRQEVKASAGGAAVRAPPYLHVFSQVLLRVARAATYADIDPGLRGCCSVHIPE